MQVLLDEKIIWQLNRWIKCKVHSWQIYLKEKKKNGFNYVSVTGYCTEYNEVGAVIQAHHNLKCENVKPPCFSSYISTEAYHCKILSISFLSLSFT